MPSYDISMMVYDGKKITVICVIHSYLGKYKENDGATRLYVYFFVFRMG